MKKNCKLLTILMMAVFAFTGCDQNPEEEVVLKGITLDTTNVKTEFTVDDEFTTDGLVVTATYSDETTKTVDGWTASGNDLSKPAESQEITITYLEGELEVSASYTIVVKAKTSGGESGKEPPATPKIALSFNTKIESYSLVKIFDVIYLSDKSNANYKDYSVCKANEISDSVLQLKVNDYDESYALTINDKAVTVTEGKVAFQDILTNTIVGKNTIKILKGEETIDTAEFTVETGYFDCPSPALKIVTKEGSSAEVGESHIIKAGENLRYGVKAGTSSKIEFEVVQEDGKAYPAEIKTSFKVENATVEKNLVTINGKNKNTYEVKVSIEVPEEYKKSGAAFSGTASFTTKYDIETGYVRTYDKSSNSWNSNYVIEYSPDGKNFTTIKDNMSEPSLYCFDEYGDIYYSFPTEGYPGYTIEKYSVDKKESEVAIQDRLFYAFSYDYDNSTLYYLYSESEYRMYIKNGEIHKRYIISGLQSNGVEPKKIVVNDENIYIWYTSRFNDENDTNILYKYTMNISDKEIKLENEQSYPFPANIKAKIESENVDVNDMILLDDDIYMAVGMGKDYSKEGYDRNTGWAISSSEYMAESRGCILKFNLLNNKFDVTGLSENKRELSSGEYNLYGGDHFIPCFSMSDMPNYDAYKLYLDEDKTKPATFKIKITCYGPELEDSDLGYVHNFAAIKPKKLVFTQGKSFMYVDGEVSFDCKIINAYSSIDLSTFAIDGSLEKIDDTNFNFKFANCISVQVFDESTTLYYGENEPGQFQTFYFQKQ